MYRITFSKDILKDLANVPQKDAERILTKIKMLAKNPRPSGIKSLQGELKGLYRIRSGDYRIVYQVKEKEIAIFIVRVGHRSSIYD